MPETAAGQPMQRGPNTHHMDAPSDVTTWTVIQTTRNVVTDDGRDMTLRDEWWEVPSFVVEQIDMQARALGRAEARAAVEDHYPEASTEPDDTPTLSCSCGWDWEPWNKKSLDWVQHILAAIDNLETP